MALLFENGTAILRKAKSDRGFSTIIAGDCCPWEKAIDIIRAGRSQEIIGNLKPFITDADLRIIQFEAPLTNEDTPIDKSGPNLKCPPECLDLLKNCGFNTALLANNHIGDYGCDAVMETIGHLRQAGIRTVGAGKNLEDANAPLQMELNGIKIALLNFAEHEFGTAGENTPGCAPLSPIDNIKAIRKASETADLVLTVIHGGHELNPVPSPRMVKTYRAFAEAGAALVMNIHTHCPEGIEIWNGVPIVYSPGNFFFPWNDPASSRLIAMWWTGYLPKFHCDNKGVYALEIMPYRFDNSRISLLTDVERDQFFAYLHHLSSILQDEAEVNRYFEGWVAQQGTFFLSLLRDHLAAWPIELEQQDAVRALLPPRNCFTCESHNDLITTYLRLIEEKKIAKALQYWPLIEKLQSPAYAKKHRQEMLSGSSDSL